MNTTSKNCFRDIFQISLLTQRQLTALIVGNSTLMAANVIVNALVIYILFHTKQIVKITYKIIFILSASDLMTGLFAQNLYTILFFDNICFVRITLSFTLTFFMHLSSYSIAIISIDRYLRIKKYANFKEIWTTKVVSSVLSIATLLALCQAIITTTGLVLGKFDIIVTVYFGIDMLIFSAIVFLQILTMRSSNALYNQSTIFASRKINKRITKLSKRIMLMLCFFMVPHLITAIFYKMIHDQLSNHGQSVFEFITLVSVMLAPANSFANAVLFLITDVKAKRFLRNLGR